jgi:hypothetical protein
VLLIYRDVHVINDVSITLREKVGVVNGKEEEMGNLDTSPRPC